MTLENVIYISWALEKLGLFNYYSYIHVELGNLDGVLLPKICVGIIVHLKIIPLTHY